MRTGACTAFFTVVAAAASGEASGRTLPIALRTGRLSITPAPFRKVRRGIIQLFSISIFLRIKSVAKRETQRDMLDQCRRSVTLLLHLLQRALHHAFVELVQ